MNYVTKMQIFFIYILLYIRYRIIINITLSLLMIYENEWFKKNSLEIIIIITYSCFIV
jgi:hypothetical protein